MKTATQRMVAYLERNHSNDILALINADRLPGQPFCTRNMLREAERGHSKGDEGWWHKLEKPHIHVLMNENEVAGVVSFANHKTDNETCLLWLHARENRAATTALVDHVISATSQPNILAFHIGFGPDMRVGSASGARQGLNTRCPLGARLCGRRPVEIYAISSTGRRRTDRPSQWRDRERGRFGERLAHSHQG